MQKVILTKPVWNCLRWLHPLAVAVAISLATAPAHAEEVPLAGPTSQSGVGEEVKKRQQDTLSELHRQSIQKRRAASERREARNMHQFRNKDGSVVFTNVPQKYENNRNYKRVSVAYQPINVPAKYKTYTTPKAYVSGDISELVSRYAQQYGLDDALIFAVIKCESNFNPNAVSRAGASGLMQLMPGTAAEMGVTRIFDPAENIAGGTQYLAQMLKIFKGDLRLALAGYNAGPEAVRRHGGIPPYQETQGYVKKVLSHYNAYANGTMKATYKNFTYMADAAAPPKPQPRAYTVTFHSGLVQTADSVVDNEPYYDIVVANRTYSIRKALVKGVEGAG